MIGKAEAETLIKEKPHQVILLDVQNGAEPISGAVSLDIKADLSGMARFLPEVATIAEKLGTLGISHTDTLIIYDEGSNRAASKAWFVMHYLGHEKVYILQGGRKAWTGAIKVGQDRQPTTYQVNIRASVLADMDKVKAEMDNEASVLIDSRAHKRYSGEVEPKYSKAGHIPGATNYHAKAAFTEDGLFKEQAQLQAHFKALHNKSEIIVSCGSGNSACMNLVALKEAGFEDVALYPGGFSEWIADEGNQVEKGEN